MYVRHVSFIANKTMVVIEGHPPKATQRRRAWELRSLLFQETGDVAGQFAVSPKRRWTGWRSRVNVRWDCATYDGFMFVQINMCVYLSIYLASVDEAMVDDGWELSTHDDGIADTNEELPLAGGLPAQTSVVHCHRPLNHCKMLLLNREAKQIGGRGSWSQIVAQEKKSSEMLRGPAENVWLLTETWRTAKCLSLQIGENDQK